MNKGERSADLEHMNELLDKLTLRQLHLIEEKMQHELTIETCIKNGAIHLAKSRYIMGQSSVSSARLPTESSTEFDATAKCEETTDNGVKQLQLITQGENSSYNPLRWFGVLVPQNMHKAQSIFQNAVNYVVDCVNTQLLLQDNMASLNALKEFKRKNQCE